MSQRSITLSINGREVTAEVEPRLLLVDFVRRVAGLTGTHVGCDTTSCGACTVWVDGLPAKSCTILALQAAGHEITTIEGVTPDGGLSDLQRAFHEHHGLQCGYCTPGMIMTATRLLSDNPSPSRREIREGISGNICRCTGYQKIVESIDAAARGR